jgi:predicted esterase
LVATALLGVVPALAIDLGAEIDRFYEATGAAELDTVIDRILASGIGAQEVATGLRRGRSVYPDVEPGWYVLELNCANGAVRPFHLLIPQSYDPTVPTPVLFSLHGAVEQRPYTVEEFLPKRGMWEEPAEENGFLVVMPHGDRDATWWSEPGWRNLHDQLGTVKRLCNVDENRVFLTGFSDGGSGTYWMAFHDPTAWAGFIPLYGSVSAAEEGAYPCYPRNLINRPILAANGSNDEVLPITAEASLITQLRLLGIQFEWEVYPTNHSLFRMIPYEWPRTVAFLSDWQRAPFRPRVLWETARVETGRCDWVRIDEIAEEPEGQGFGDLNLEWIWFATQFGAGLDYDATRNLFPVSGVAPDSTAHRLGVKTGDVILTIGGQTVKTNEDVAGVMSGKLPGDPIVVELVRDGETLVLRGTVPEAELVYRRDGVTGSIYVNADGNDIAVTSRNVARYTLFVSTEQFDFSEPIRVTTNGQESFAGTIEPDLEFMLRQAALDRDRQAVYEARVEVAVLPDE